MLVSRSIVLVFALVSSVEALGQPQRRAAIAFSGTTSASKLLIQDVMKNVRDLGDAEFDCAMPEAVVAEVLPENFQAPEQEATPEGAGLPVYERWTIEFCGSEVPFLLTFWTMAHGGTAFDLMYPYAEAVSAVEDGTTRLQ